MDNQEYNSIVSFIWGIADDCLRDVYVRGKYRDVILPMTVIRRLDAMLEETKENVLIMKQQLDAAHIVLDLFDRRIVGYAIDDRNDNKHVYENRKDLVSALERYLHYYNFERLQRRLSIMTPQEYHNHYLAA